MLLVLREPIGCEIRASGEGPIDVLFRCGKVAKGQHSLPTWRRFYQSAGTRSIALALDQPRLKPTTDGIWWVAGRVLNLRPLTLATGDITMARNERWLRPP